MGAPDDDLDVSIFRPRLGRRTGHKEPTFRLAVIRKLGRSASGWAGSRRAAAAHSRRVRYEIRPASSESRRCVVKARYVSLTREGAKAARAHLAYIEREGVEQDGSKGRLFDGAGDVERDEFAAKIPREKRQFRFIVAPEDGNEIDLRSYTTQLMERMEKDVGRRLRWAAVCHYNTDNPHVHIVVRGVDKVGQEVRIDRRYMSEGLRLRGQELATLELGPRTEADLQRQQNRDVTAERLTAIDRRLASWVSEEKTLSIATITEESTPRSKPAALARLQVLEQLQLVERTSASSWQFADGWQEELKSLGERGDIIKRIHRALPGRDVAHRLFEYRDGAGIEGIVREKGLHDEDGRGGLYAVVETARDTAVYVRLDETTAASLREGMSVKLTCALQPWVKGTDHVIAREAATNGGLYSPAAHLKKLGDQPLAIDGRWVWPEDMMAVNRRRLERLARYNLATALPDGSWRVPANLVTILREREQTHPRFQLQVTPLRPERDRSRTRGPTFSR